MSVENLYPREMLFDDPETLDKEEPEPGFDLSSAKIYHREIAQIPILDPIETRQLGEFIQNGKFSEEVMQMLEFLEIPTEGEVHQIKARADVVPIARDRLVTGYLRFGAHVARLTMGWTPHGSNGTKTNGETIFKGGRVKDLSVHAKDPMPYEDRIQEASLALLKAALKYKPNGGANFTTYAMYWIEQAIGRAIDYDRNIKVPIDILEALRKVIQKPGELTESTFRTIDCIRGIESALQKRDYLLDIRQTDSLDELREGDAHLPEVGAHDDPVARLDEILEDDENIDEEEVFQRVTADAVRRALLALPERERRILELRFGFEGGDPWTLEEIGHELDLTRERVRQLEGQALARLGSLRSLYDEVGSSNSYTRYADTIERLHYKIANSRERMAKAEDKMDELSWPELFGYYRDKINLAIDDQVMSRLLNKSFAPSSISFETYQIDNMINHLDREKALDYKLTLLKRIARRVESTITIPLVDFDKWIREITIEEAQKIGLI